MKETMRNYRKDCRVCEWMDGWMEESMLDAKRSSHEDLVLDVVDVVG